MEEAKSGLKQTNAKSQSDATFLSIKFNPTSITTVPDIGKLYYNELRQRVNEISQHSSTLMPSASKVFSRLFKGKKEVDSSMEARITGNEILAFHRSPVTNKAVDALQKNPYEHKQRLTLSVNILKSGEPLSVEQMRQILMQIAVPIGLGNFSSENIKILTSHYKNFRKVLFTEYLREIERIWAANPESRDFGNDPSFKSASGNRKIVEKLMKRSIYRVQPSDRIIAMNETTLKQAIEGRLKFSSGSNLLSTKQQIETNLVKIIMALLDIEFLYPELIRITKEYLIPLKPLNPMAYFIQGCIWMNQLQIIAIFEEQNPKVRKLMNNVLQHCLESYGKSLKFLPAIEHNKELQQKILIEHAQICLYAYTLRKKLCIPVTVYRQLVITGYKSLIKSEIDPRRDSKRVLERYKETITKEKLEEKIKETSLEHDGVVKS